MKQDGRTPPTIAILSPRSDDFIVAIGNCGWRTLTLVDASPNQAEFGEAHAFLIDVREGIDPDLLLALPSCMASVAVIGADREPSINALIEIGITHFLTWPVSENLLKVTLEAAYAVHKRLNETTVSDPALLSDDASDSLTGLASRLAAREWLDARLSGVESEEIAACLLIGISQFASVNTAYGQKAGDAVLARVAGRIKRCVSRVAGEGSLVARLGGTEYLIVPGSNEVSASGMTLQELARLLLTDISRPFVADDTVIRLTARCGLALPVQGDDASSLLRRANAALADARRSAASDICTRSGIRRRGKHGADDVDRLDADLRLALDRGEIGVVYQPQYDSITDRITGAEALARWNHPQLGQLDAATLFEAADRSDYLLPLSYHIQDMALREAGKWPRALDGLRLSINVTAADVAQDDFLSRTLSMIDRSGFPRDRLTIEITESGLIENIARAGDLLEELRQGGLRIAIDDFGTGYSSLAYLKALHPDSLKIDHSLSRDILGTSRDRIILRAIIAMAKSLALTVIAEGVENEQQLTMLAREGCDVYQGFLRSPAVTSQELIKLVGENR